MLAVAVACAAATVLVLPAFGADRLTKASSTNYTYDANGQEDVGGVAVVRVECGRACGELVGRVVHEWPLPRATATASG